MTGVADGMNPGVYFRHCYKKIQNYSSFAMPH